MAKVIGSKRFKRCLEMKPTSKLPVGEAVKAVKAFPATKFNATVNIVMHLGIDPKQADQLIRGSISLPHGIGKTKKVIAFCDGENIEKARAAGAIEAGADDLVKKVNDGWLDFDVAIATPAMMKVVSKLGRVLGPTGKMPAPKAGTVVEDIAKAVKEYAAGKVEYRNDDHGNVHAVVGKVNFDEKALTENVDAFIANIKRVRPASVKGVYIKKISISASMTPGVEVAAE